MSGLIITCPRCDYKADAEEFDVSLSDECFCPKCGEYFLLELESDGDDDRENDTA